MMENKASLKLGNPIKFGEEFVSEIGFREPKAKDIWNLMDNDGLKTSTILELAQKLSSKPKVLFEELSIADTFKVIELVSGFFPNSREIVKS